MATPGLWGAVADPVGDKGVCVCVSGVNRVKGIVAHGEVLTAVCTHCHAAESSVIYSVIGA